LFHIGRLGLELRMTTFGILEEIASLNYHFAIRVLMGFMIFFFNNNAIESSNQKESQINIKKADCFDLESLGRAF
jgi:arginine utilization protein RocB